MTKKKQVTVDQIENLAKIIKTHVAFDSIMELIRKDIFDKWERLKTDDVEGMDNLKKVSDNQRLFIQKLTQITEIAEAKKPINEDDDGQSKK